MPDAAANRNRDDFNVRAVLWTGVAIVVMLALAAVGAYAAWHAWAATSAHDAPNASRGFGDFAIAGPTLQSAPQADRTAFMADKARLLHSHEWIDPAAGIARIPIDDAMRILAARGAPHVAPKQKAR